MTTGKARHILTIMAIIIPTLPTIATIKRVKGTQQQQTKQQIRRIKPSAASPNAFDAAGQEVVDSQLIPDIDPYVQ